MRFTSIYQQVAAACTCAMLLGACEGSSPTAFRPDQAALTSACAEHPDVIVRDRDELLSALTSAQPGQTIAIDGMIEIDYDGNVETAGLTFDCATPGSGLSAAPGVGLWLFIVKAPGVTVQNLVLDASQGYGAYLSDKNGVDAFAERLVFRGNTVTCQEAECVFVQTPTHAFGEGAFVADNHVTQLADGIGIHVQGFTGVTVVRNDVRAPAQADRGIVVNGAREVAITDNVVAGPWRRGLDLLDGVLDTRIERNRFDGATVYPVGFAAVDSITFAANTVRCAVACLFALGTSRVTINANNFSADGAMTGVHLQGGGEENRITGNRIVATAPSGSAAFGAIRIRSGARFLIQGNDISGPWSNGMAVQEFDGGRVDDNRMTGSTGVGAYFLDTRATGFQGNVLAMTGQMGILLDRACGNTLAGNNLQHAAPVGLQLGQETGANSYAGNRSLVVDDGAYDCDGDGVADPNILSGTGTPLSGMAINRPFAPEASNGALQ
jgi:nitrous oxidase accessory protein NosD